MFLVFIIVLVALAAGAAVRLRSRQRVPPAESAEPSEPAPAPNEEVAALVRDNKLIEAIKVYREKHEVDLLTAKNAVEKLAGR